jgi:hypothetical protein
MKISYWPLPLSKNGAGGFPNRIVINSRLRFEPQELQRVIDNEAIHVLQQMEFSDNPDEWTWEGYFKWLYTYISLQRKYGYCNNPMEVDSRYYDTDIKSRPRFYWKTVLKQMEATD